MTPYKIAKNKETQLFELIENATEQVIVTDNDHATVSKIYRDMNKLNTGFQGWTPNFFLLKW